MSTNKRIIIYFFGITFLVLGVLAIYGFNKYTLLESRIQIVQITSNEDISPEKLPTIYFSGASEPKINFGDPYKFKRTSDGVYQAKLDDSLMARSFRLYFEWPGEKFIISDLALLTSEKTYPIDLSQKLSLNNIKKTNVGDSYIIEAQELRSYLDGPKQYIYPSDFKGIFTLVLPVLLVILLLTFMVYNLKRYDFKSMSLSELSLAIFIFTIFLPEPIYNVALILTVLVNFRKISFKQIFDQKINLVFIAFFLLYLMNNLFISEEGYRSMDTIERFLPLLLIPIIIPGIANKKLLIVFPVSALVLGFGLLVTSVFDIFIHDGNMDFISFDNFSKYLHPVYYSYLLFFSVIFIQHYYHGKMKTLIQVLLFAFLIFSGSKMVIVFALLSLIITRLNGKKTILGIGLFGILILLFAPLNNRFKTIFKTEDFSVLKESHLEDDNDARINGLTLRLILWREALTTMHGVDYIFGKGVTDATDLQLQQGMQKFGLEQHKTYNPHNQYVDTFWRTGILGFILLIMIPIYGIRWGIKNKEMVLVQFSALLLVVMLTESIFGRVRGIYFFTLVIVLLMNSSKTNEDSHIRN